MSKPTSANPESILKRDSTNSVGSSQWSLTQVEMRRMRDEAVKVLRTERDIRIENVRAAWTARGDFSAGVPKPDVIQRHSVCACSLAAVNMDFAALQPVLDHGPQVIGEMVGQLMAALYPYEGLPMEGQAELSEEQRKRNEQRRALRREFLEQVLGSARLLKWIAPAIGSGYGS